MFFLNTSIKITATQWNNPESIIMQVSAIYFTGDFFLQSEKFIQVFVH